MQRRAVVATGTSTGIDESTAALLIQKGFHVFGGVRREADGERLRGRLGDGFTSFILDVTNEDAIARGATEVEQMLDGATLAGLVNNAGIAAGGPLAHLSLDASRKIMGVNLFGAVAVTQAFLPLLGCDRALSGKPQARAVVVRHRCDCRRSRLRRHADLGQGPQGRCHTLPGHRICARAVALHGICAGCRAQGRSAGTHRAYHHKALTAPSPKARYAPVKGKFMNWTLPGLLPKRFVDRKIGRALGMLD